MGGISIWQLLIIAVIVVLLFGTNKLRTLGSDLGASIKALRKPLVMMKKRLPPTRQTAVRHLRMQILNRSLSSSLK